MDDPLHLEMVRPSSPLGDNVARRYVMVLSDWLPVNANALVKRVTDVFGAPEWGSASSQAPLPLVLIVDDTRENHHEFLASLGAAGAIVLEPEEEDLDAARADPLGYAAAQMTVASPMSGSPGWGTDPHVPTHPDGYRDFAKAFTRLPDEEIDAIIEGRRPSDEWRYEM
jgi:hypothetical protein